MMQDTTKMQADFGADPIDSALRSGILKATGLLSVGRSKVRLARYHSATNSSLSPMDRALGTALLVSVGGLHHARAWGERSIKLVGQGQGAATTA